MGKNIVQQVRVVTGPAKLKQSTFVQEQAFYDANGNPVSIGVTKAAANADVATANATDLATAIALANQLKTSFNSLQAKLRTAGLLTP